jgi:hypothetical protein
MRDLAHMFRFLWEGKEPRQLLQAGDWDHCTAVAVITHESATLFSSVVEPEPKPY